MRSSIQTKRYMFYTLMQHIERVESIARENNGVFQCGCISLAGARGVGKTTVLLQLYDEAPEISEYVDISKLPKGFNFQEFFRAKYDAGVRRIYLDEICKIDKDDKADLISNIKICASVMFFVCTGNTSSAVKEMNSLIGRGVCYDLPPIMYAERLAWSAGALLSSAPDYRCLSSMDKFNEYLNFSGFEGSGDTAKTDLRYLSDAVRETSDLFFKKYDELRSMPKEKLDLILRYISLCQHIYKAGDSEFCDIPGIEKDIHRELEQVYGQLINKFGISSDNIRAVCDALIDSGLAERMYPIIGRSELDWYREREIYVPMPIDDDLTPLVFKFPHYGDFALANLIPDADVIQGVRAEDMILTKLADIYNYIDIYRYENESELSVVYETNVYPHSLHGIRIMNKRSDQADKAYIERCISFAEKAKLDSLCITCTDKNNVKAYGSTADVKVKFFRTDYVVLALEQAYIRKTNEIAESVLHPTPIGSLQSIMQRYDLI